MSSDRRVVRRKRQVMILASIAITVFLFPRLHAEETPIVRKNADMFVYPDTLTAKDQLTDGQDGKAIEIKAETTLIWVDRMPEARYSHPTEYVLISAEGTRVIQGGWWPVLNGKAVLRGEKPYQVNFPIRFPGK